ncbi:MAG: adenosylmethionine--8-amino-7-oxononanoate transaminase [Bacteroidota bacterium]
MSLQERDKRHIWHPLTQHGIAAPPLGIVKARGALLWDEEGRSYIDGIASWYTAMYGHCNDAIADAVNHQMRQLDQVVFTGFTHEPAVRLAEKLIELLPDNQQKVFFNDNGSTAVEAAIKMAIQYHANKGRRRDTLIAFEDGFHGDTFGAMSVSGLSVYNGPFEDFFLKVIRIPVPQENTKEAVLAQLESLIEEHKCAAFVYEPLVQGAAGMKFHDAAGLELLLQCCRKHDVLSIADEVMTGFGKTGKHFASLHLETQPDIFCLSKSLTAGMLPMSVTTTTQEVFDAFLDTEIAKGFFHAHTYTANPLGCAAALAGIELLQTPEIQDAIARIERSHQLFSEKIKKHPKVATTRTKGVIFALEIDVDMARYGTLRDQLFEAFMNDGVFLRPLGNVVYILPPFVISTEQLNTIYESIERVLDLL